MGEEDLTVQVRRFNLRVTVNNGQRSRTFKHVCEMRNGPAPKPSRSNNEHIEGFTYGRLRRKFVSPGSKADVAQTEG